MTGNRRSSSALLVVLAAGTLAGCTVGPNYSRPEIATPGSFSGTGAVTETATTRAEAAAADEQQLARWWDVLGDAEMTSLIERGLAANHDLRIATERVRESRALRAATAAGRMPTVDARAGASVFRDSSTTDSGFGGTGNQQGELFDVGLDASWEIDVFGGIKRGIEAADADLSASIEDRRAVLVTLVAEIARNYTELRGLRMRETVLRNAIIAQQDTVDLTRSRADVGLATDLDVAQARAELATRTGQLPPVLTAVKQAEHRLAVLIGTHPGSLAGELAEAGGMPTAPGTIPVGLPADLLRRRPDIRRAERQLAAATARIGVATAELYPKFSIGAGLGLDSGDALDLTDVDSLAWRVGPSVRWSVFDGGRNRANIEAADARAAQVLASYEQSVLIAVEEVENALVALAQEQARRTSLRESVAANQEAVQLATERYNSRLSAFLDVLDSQRSLFDAQDQLVQSETAVVTGVIALYKALGGGWSEPGVQPPQESTASAGR